LKANKTVSILDINYIEIVVEAAKLMENLKLGDSKPKIKNIISGNYQSSTSVFLSQLNHNVSEEELK